MNCRACTYKSQIFAQSQLNFAPSHDCETVTFRKSGWRMSAVFARRLSSHGAAPHCRGNPGRGIWQGSVSGHDMCWAVHNCVGQHKFVLDSTTLCWAVQICIEQHKTVLGSTKLCWAAQTCVGQHKTVLGSTNLC